MSASAKLLGLLGADPEAWFTGSEPGELSGDDVEELIVRRKAARSRHDFAEADRIRDELTAAGIAIEDSSDGTRWRRT